MLMPPAVVDWCMTSPSRVLVVGLDAACFEELDRLVAAGEVPTIASLLDRGVAAPLETTAPPWTPSAWPSVVTGATPFVHGVYDFHQYRGAEPALVSARDVRVPFVWETLSEAGKRSIVVNVPVTHPIHGFDGSLVPGYLAPEGTDCLVDGSVVPVTDIDPGYTVYARETDSRAARLAEYERLVDARVRIARTLADRTPDWAFMMVQFQSTDAVFHTDGGDDAAVTQVYRRVDAAVAELREVAGEDAAIFLVSDHGIKQYERVVYLNAWLRETGRLVTSADSRRHVWNERSKAAVAGDDPAAGTDAHGDARGPRRGLVDRAIALGVGAFSRVGATPERVERALSRVGLDEAVARLLPESALYDVVDAAAYVDRERSAAYCRSLSALGVRCNVAGRDPGGVVPAAEFDTFRAALIADLEALRAPDGSLVFEAVLDRHDESVAGGDVANERDAPDVLLRPSEMDWKVSDVVRERVFGHTDEYSHTWTGIVVAAGPGVAPESEREQSQTGAAHDSGLAVAAGIGQSTSTTTPSVIDVTPTVLALLGVPQPATVQGRSLTPAVTALEVTPDGRRGSDPDPSPTPSPSTGREPARASAASASPVRPASATAPARVEFEFRRRFLADEQDDGARDPSTGAPGAGAGAGASDDERGPEPDREVDDVVTDRLREMGYL